MDLIVLVLYVIDSMRDFAFPKNLLAFKTSLEPQTQKSSSAKKLPVWNEAATSSQNAPLADCWQNFANQLNNCTYNRSK